VSPTTHYRSLRQSDLPLETLHSAYALPDSPTMTSYISPQLDVIYMPVPMTALYMVLPKLGPSPN
jgi:hypothetical protein